MVQNSSSFIPREKNTGSTPTRVRRKRTFNIFSFIASALLIGSLLLAGGTYFFLKSSEHKLVAEKNELQNQKGKFSEEKIAEVRNFDKQLRAASYLMNNHIAPTVLFEALEKHTKEKVQYTDLEFSYDPGFETLVTLKGGTNEFKTVSLQSTEFKNSELLSTALFTDVGTVGDVKSEVKPSKGTSKPQGATPDYNVGFTTENAIPLSLLRYTGVQTGDQLMMTAPTTQPTSLSTGMDATSTDIANTDESVPTTGAQTDMNMNSNQQQ